MPFLVDGYNLLHALGLAERSPGRGVWQRAGTRLLDWLADGHAGKPEADVLVVFDAQAAPGRGSEAAHRGVRVVFARGGTADDWIEEMVGRERVPARLTVVSNDNRIALAARRRGCPAWSCQEYTDYLLVPTRPRPEPAAGDEKPTAVGDADEWLRIFGDQ